MNRLPGLDLMRAIAIIWVMFYHGGVMGLGSPLPAVTQLGWMGVDLFFVLSGFLIGSQWLAECQPGQPAPFGRFYLRRAFRILPAYLLMVALYFGWPALREQQPIMPLWQFLTFTENLLIEVTGPRAFSHVWSLCVEEHFYLLFPLIAWLMLRRPSAGRTAALLAAVVLGGLAWRAHVWLDDVSLRPDATFIKGFMERLYYPSWTRLDGLVAGIGLALLKTYRPRIWQAAMARGNAMLLAGGLLLAIAAVWMFQDDPNTVSVIYGYPTEACAWMLIVAGAASERSVLGRWRVPGAGTVAMLAYSLYLCHKMAYHAMSVAHGPWLKQHGAIAILAYGGAALLAGCALHWCIERPGLRLRERYLQGGPMRLPTPATQAAG